MARNLCSHLALETGACSFEGGDFCTWRNEIGGTDNFDWDISTGRNGIADNTIGDFTG